MGLGGLMYGKELKIWLFIYTKQQMPVNFSKDFSLRDQVQRAAVSVASNIAEGDERDTDKDSVRFFFMAKGSLAEMLTQIIISNEIGYLKEQDFKYISDECETIAKMLGKLIKARTKNGQ